MPDVKVCTADAPLVPWKDALEATLKETGKSLARAVQGDFSGLGDVQQDGRLAGVIVTGKKWQVGRTIRVKFMGGDPRVIERIKPYFTEWTKYANLTFEFVDSGDAEIRVSLVSGDGSWSYIGTDALTIPQDRATMNYGWLTPEGPEDEYSRVVLHEVGHALGMPHEHQHPEGGIPWDREAVYRYYSSPPNNWDRATIDRNLFQRYSETITQFSEFDRDSIMLYAIAPELLTDPSKAVGWNRTLSETDKAFAAEQYPGKVEPPETPKRLPIEHYDRATNADKVRMGDVILVAGRAREDFAEVKLLGRFRR